MRLVEQRSDLVLYVHLFGTRPITLVFDFAFSGFRFLVSGFGFQVSYFGFQISGIGPQVSGFRFRVSVLGFRVDRYLLRVSCSRGSTRLVIGATWSAFIAKKRLKFKNDSWSRLRRALGGTFDEVSVFKLRVDGYLWEGCGRRRGSTIRGVAAEWGSVPFGRLREQGEAVVSSAPRNQPPFRPYSRPISRALR
jgi:hypothetical protein